MYLRRQLTSWMTRESWNNCASMLPNGSSNNLQTQAAATKTVPKHGRSVGTVHRFAHLQLRLTYHCTLLAPTVAGSVTSRSRMPVPMRCNGFNHTVACRQASASGHSHARRAECPDVCVDFESGVQPRPVLSWHSAVLCAFACVACMHLISLAQLWCPCRC